MGQSCTPADVRERIKRIRYQVAQAAIKSGRMPDDIRIMAVTKRVDPALISVAISEGITLLGENRVQEYLSKRDEYPASAQVHFIGQLQTNKIKYIADTVCMIQSVSSCEMAEKLGRYMKKSGKTMDVLLEVNIGKEPSKAGFHMEELTSKIQNMANIENIRVRGLMCIPPIEKTERFFYGINQLLVDIKRKKIDNISMNILSMGMSSDFETAIRHGSTLIRLGTALFGARKDSS